MSLINKTNEYFEVVEVELKALASQYKEISTDLSYLVISPEDPEDVIEQKEKDAKKKKAEITKIRTSIEKTAKSYREGFNKASKDVIALEKPLKAPLIEDEELLKAQINYRKIRSEKVAEELHSSRINQISEFEGFYNPIFFGAMAEDQWQKTLAGAKLASDAHKKQEEDRIAEQKRESEEAERLRREVEALKAEAKLREHEAKKEVAEAGSGGSGEIKEELSTTQGRSELSILLDGINNLITNSIKPIDQKDQVAYNNTIDLLNKARQYLEFSL